jgi:hypothetical protein
MTAKLTNLREYLRSVSEMMQAIANSKRKPTLFSSMYDFLLNEGIDCIYTGHPRPKGCGVRKMPDKECFGNAHTVASTLPERFAYVEGYALGIIPMAHAWLIDMDGKVVDPTWQEDHCREYIGVPFDLEYVNRIIIEKETYGALDYWEGGWPILTGEHKPEEYRDKRFPRKADQ